MLVALVGLAVRGKAKDLAVEARAGRRTGVLPAERRWRARAIVVPRVGGREAAVAPALHARRRPRQPVGVHVVKRLVVVVVHVVAMRQVPLQVGHLRALFHLKPFCQRQPRARRRCRGMGGAECEAGG